MWRFLYSQNWWYCQLWHHFPTNVSHQYIWKKLSFLTMLVRAHWLSLNWFHWKMNFLHHLEVGKFSILTIWYVDFWTWTIFFLNSHKSQIKFFFSFLGTKYDELRLSGLSVHKMTSYKRSNLGFFTYSAHNAK